MSELNERKSRECNVILKGLKENEDQEKDLTVLKDMLKDTSFIFTTNLICFLVPVDKGNARPLKIKLSSPGDTQWCVRNSTSIFSSGIKLSCDLTRKQQQVFSKVYKELENRRKKSRTKNKFYKLPPKHLCLSLTQLRKLSTVKTFTNCQRPLILTHLLIGLPPCGSHEKPPEGSKSSKNRQFVSGRKSNLIIYYQNIQSIKDRYYELANAIHQLSHVSDIIIRTETLLHPEIADSKLGLTAYNVYCCDRPEIGNMEGEASVLIVLKKSISVFQINCASNECEQLLLKLHLGNAKILLGGVYFSPSCMTSRPISMTKAACSSVTSA